MKKDFISTLQWCVFGKVPASFLFIYLFFVVCFFLFFFFLVNKLGSLSHVPPPPCVAVGRGGINTDKADRAKQARQTAAVNLQIDLWESSARKQTHVWWKAREQSGAENCCASSIDRLEGKLHHMWKEHFCTTNNFCFHPARESVRTLLRPNKCLCTAAAAPCAFKSEEQLVQMLMNALIWN